MGVDALLGRAWISDGEGHMVNSSWVRLKEIIEDYDPTMSLVWITPSSRQPSDTHPFAVMHEPGNKPPYIIFTLTESEVENPADVLARLFRGDLRKTDVFADIKAYQAAQKIVKLKEQMDEHNERINIALSARRALSGGHRWRHNGVMYG